MSRDKLLLIATVTGSALCWWPAIIEPGVDFPRWILLALVASIAGLSTILSEKRSLRFVIATIAGAFAGLCGGCALFPSSDGITNSIRPLGVLLVTMAASLVSFPAGLIGLRLPVFNENHRRALWFALGCCLAFGPAGLAITPPLVAHRVARNDRIAADRFRSLKSAAERTKAEAGNQGRICDTQTFRRHYSGPPFSEEDWQRIAGNYVRQDGYYFIVRCRETSGYTIDASPSGGKANGTRRFCTDRCNEWLRSQHLCVACTG